jgi:uncharacterized protein
MKRPVLFLIFVLMTVSLYAQEVTGQWNGILSVQGTQLSIVFNVMKTETGYTSTMDSPDQGFRGIPVTSTVFENLVLKIEVAMGGIRFEGVLSNDDKLIGEFRQGNLKMPLTLTRNVPEKVIVSRPQDPVEPYPYRSEEVLFVNPGAGVSLAGTLTIPQGEGEYPAVILISGSGPQDRNEELLGHRPFLVLADHLTRNGIAVLRYDDRGIAKSTGEFNKATTLDLATDAEAAVSYLLTRREINKKEIGLIGHSEGGLIASMVAAENKKIRFIVLMAGPGLRGYELLLKQEELLARANNVSEDLLTKSVMANKEAFDLILNTADDQLLVQKLDAYLKQQLAAMPATEKPAGVSDEDLINQQRTQLTSPWFKFFLKYDPASMLQKVKCPVLALNGSKDLQVSPRENLSAIKSNLEKGGNNNVTIREYPSLNHLFQECKTGSPNEYKDIQQTIFPQVLNEISGWILKQTK